MLENVAFLVRHHRCMKLHRTVNPEDVSTVGFDRDSDEKICAIVFIHSPGSSDVVLGVSVRPGDDWIAAMNQEVGRLIAKVFDTESVMEKVFEA
tara:strand:- start:21492 stop:21773 length:282 start_codon:yes stop_codon:yes gene_type:complete